MNEWYNDYNAEPVSTEPPAPEEAQSAQETTPAAQTESPLAETPASVTEEAQPVQEVPASAPSASPYGAQPPRTPYTPSQNAPYTAPSYSPYNQPPRPAYTTQPIIQTTKKKTSGTTVAVAILAVLCSISLIVSGVLAVMLVGGDSSNGGGSQSPVTSGDKADDDAVINENGPTLQITDIEAINDGGLATSEIVAKNLDATVVLTMYAREATSIYGYYGFDAGTSDNLTQAGAASGIIMSEDGYIITNSHCVYDEETQTEYARIDVTLYDGRVYEGAQIIGYDPTTDLAVIKIDETGLTSAEFGDSSALSLGDRVVTLGNSGGLQWSVSQGILSGQARDVYEDTGYAIKCLQVDAIINPGSSGGPLLNAYGQVVGVNSAKIVLTGYEGLGFSIPINEAKTVIDDLIKYGYVTGRVSLGIMGRTITSIGYEGFMIESINADSALSGTNAAPGDIITHVNGERVTSYAEMRSELTGYSVGETITLTLLRLDRQTRQTQEFNISVTLQESK